MNGAIIWGLLIQQFLLSLLLLLVCWSLIQTIPWYWYLYFTVNNTNFFVLVTAEWPEQNTKATWGTCSKKCTESKNTPEQVRVLSLTCPKFVAAALAAHGLHNTYVAGAVSSPNCKGDTTFGHQLRNIPESELWMNSVTAELCMSPHTVDDPLIQLWTHLWVYPRTHLYPNLQPWCKLWGTSCSSSLDLGLEPGNGPRVISHSSPPLYLSPLFGYGYGIYPLFYFLLLLFVYSSGPILAGALSYSFRTSC